MVINPRILDGAWTRPLSAIALSSKPLGTAFLSVWEFIQRASRSYLITIWLSQHTEMDVSKHAQRKSRGQSPGEPRLRKYLWHDSIGAILSLTEFIKFIKYTHVRRIHSRTHIISILIHAQIYHLRTSRLLIIISWIENTAYYVII